jgi:hypothetical protein
MPAPLYSSLSQAWAISIARMLAAFPPRKQAFQPRVNQRGGRQQRDEYTQVEGANPHEPLLLSRVRARAGGLSCDGGLDAIIRQPRSVQSSVEGTNGLTYSAVSSALLN